MRTSVYKPITPMPRSNRTISHKSFDTSDFESTNAAEWNDESADGSEPEEQTTRYSERKPITCRFWAKNGSCRYTKESCKFLHEYTAESPTPNSTDYRRSNRVYDLFNKEPWREQPSGKLINILEVLELPTVEVAPKIERCEYLASYNWLYHSLCPTILVPGMYLVLL
jgi:hypothetical protein